MKKIKGVYFTIRITFINHCRQSGECCVEYFFFKDIQTENDVGITSFVLHKNNKNSTILGE